MDCSRESDSRYSAVQKCSILRPSCLDRLQIALLVPVLDVPAMPRTVLLLSQVQMLCISCTSILFITGSHPSRDSNNFRLLGLVQRESIAPSTNPSEISHAHSPARIFLDSLCMMGNKISTIASIPHQPTFQLLANGAGLNSFEYSKPKN